MYLYGFIELLGSFQKLSYQINVKKAVTSLMLDCQLHRNILQTYSWAFDYLSSKDFQMEPLRQREHTSL